jgi:hypothetical protein
MKNLVTMHGMKNIKSHSGCLSHMSCLIRVIITRRRRSISACCMSRTGENPLSTCSGTADNTKISSTNTVITAAKYRVCHRNLSGAQLLCLKTPQVPVIHPVQENAV